MERQKEIERLNNKDIKENVQYISVSLVFNSLPASTEIKNLSKLRDNKAKALFQF